MPSSHLLSLFSIFYHFGCTSRLKLHRLLRQYFPKKTKAVYTAAYLADCRQKINTRPRKCLGFASPASWLLFELKKSYFKVKYALAGSFTKDLSKQHSPQLYSPFSKTFFNPGAERFAIFGKQADTFG